MRACRLPRLPVLVCLVSALGCGTTDATDVAGPGADAIAALIAPGADVRPLKLNHQQLAPVWTVSKAQEVGCGGPGVAGGEVGGNGNFTHLGNSAVDVSAAWDIDHLIQTPARYTPVGPASGPVAPVVGQSGYPYAFHFDPGSGTCQPSVQATGKVVLTAANGDVLYGDITGGEAHKLDFIIDGDGVETFAEVSVTGGTGRLADATGTFVVHTIARVQPTLRFAITLAEILPGGTLGY